MMFQPELAQWSGEERYSRLLAEAAQARRIKALQANALLSPWSWVQRASTAARQWLAQKQPDTSIFGQDSRFDKATR